MYNYKMFETQKRCTQKLFLFSANIDTTKITINKQIPNPQIQKTKKTPDSDILFKKIIVPLHTLNHEDTLLQN